MLGFLALYEGVDPQFFQTDFLVANVPELKDSPAVITATATGACAHAGLREDRGGDTCAHALLSVPHSSAPAATSPSASTPHHSPLRTNARSPSYISQLRSYLWPSPSPSGSVSAVSSTVATTADSSSQPQVGDSGAAERALVSLLLSLPHTQEIDPEDLRHLTHTHDVHEHEHEHDHDHEHEHQPGR